jgi:hypothetical protein
VNGELLHDGAPVVVATTHERIGRGPWARLLATAVVPDEGSTIAESGRTLARSGNVHTVVVGRRTLTGRVAEQSGEYSVTITAEPVPPRIWAAVVRSVRGKEQLAAAAEGHRQSVQLEYLMAVDWEEPLVPRPGDLGRVCTCPAAGACAHIAALAYAFASEIDREPSLLLRWRGCVEPPTDGPSLDEESAAPVSEPALELTGNDDIWRAGTFPEPRPLRPLPPGAVMKRLGPSGLRIGGADLSELLLRAYASFAASARR